MSELSTAEGSTRQRGRPRVDKKQLAARQKMVIAAAARLLSERYIREITVEQVITEAGISRPTFYRWFPGGTEELFDSMVAEAYGILARELAAVISGEGDLEKRVNAGVGAYFDWCISQGPVAYTILRDAFNQQSVVYPYRRRTIEFLVEVIRQQAFEDGVPDFGADSVETIITWIEGAAIIMLRDFPVPVARRNQQCLLATEMFIALVRRARDDDFYRNWSGKPQD